MTAVPVASPYAVFRAADLAWVPPVLPLPMAVFAAASLAAPKSRPRKRLSAAEVIQGELFLLPTR